MKVLTRSMRYCHQVCIAILLHFTIVFFINYVSNGRIKILFVFNCDQKFKIIKLIKMIDTNPWRASGGRMLTLYEINHR